MRPAFSVIVFTVLAGAAQGLVVAIALSCLADMPIPPRLVALGLPLAALMLVVGLSASFMHLGRPERAWRAALMWRTSWLSREVIMLPAFIGLIALWWIALNVDVPAAWTHRVFPAAALVVAALLWICTAMIYACLRFIEEWAHPLTLVGFVLTGLSSGFILAAAIASSSSESPAARLAGRIAIGVTLSAWAVRAMALHRNDTLRHKSTLHSATGIPGTPLRQQSMGISAGSFNTREFFHGQSSAVIRNVRLALSLFGFALPACLALLAVTTGSTLPWLPAVVSQAFGLVADRWYFFAQAKHPQNLYYQVVS